MKVETLAIPGVLLITPRRFADPRGWFAESWNEPRYQAVGIPGPFVQDNHSGIEFAFAISFQEEAAGIPKNFGNE